jgi:hypothetical protein
MRKLLKVKGDAECRVKQSVSKGVRKCEIAEDVDEAT